MPALFIYLIKVNAALLIFCAGYYGVLRHLTFYNLNRAYLVTAIIFSTLYPAINLSGFLNRHDELAKPVQVVIINWQEPVQNIAKTFLGHDIWFWLQAAFWAGVVLFAIRLMTQLISLYKLHQRSKPVEMQQYMIRVIKGNVNPFSFWRSIYINPDNHEPHELSAILEHEQIHVKEWHTLDILLGEVSTIFYWFNPGVWLMKRAIRENIEFITDHKILQKGLDSRAYQYSLLKVNFGVQGNAIVNHFNISTIKKRIIMMNAKRSSKVNITRYLLLLPTVMVLLLVFSVSKAELKKAAKNSAHIITAFKTAITKIQLKTADASAAAIGSTDHASNVLLNAVSFFNIDADTTKKEVTKLSGNIDVVKDSINGKRVTRIYTTNYNFSYADKDKDGQITAYGIETVDTNKKAVIRLIGTGGNKPDIYINGVKSETGLENISPDNILTVNVKRGTSSNGEIYVVTKGHEADNVFGVKGYAIKDTVIMRRAGGGRVNSMTADKVVIGSNGNNEVVVTGYSTNPKVNKIMINGQALPSEVNGTVKQIIINGDTIRGNNIYDVRGSSKKTHTVDSILRALPGVQIDAQGNVTHARAITGISIRPTPITLANKLIIIDGKVASEKQMKNLSADKIESVSNMSGDAARAAYGEKGKNGVVIITTKKAS